MSASSSGADTSSGNAPHGDTSDASTSEGPAEDSSSDGSSSTGETFTFSADDVWWERSCGEMGAVAWIELFPGHGDGLCAPPADASDDYVLILLQPWDGQGGTFVLDEDGPSQAAIGMGIEQPVGEVTIEVSAPWQLVAATIELSTTSASVMGTADLSACGTAQVGDPCE